MSQRVIIDWLEERYPQKYTAPEMIKYTGLSSQAVYSALKTLREKNELCCDMIVTPGKNYDRHSYHYSYQKKFKLFKKEKINLNKLKFIVMTEGKLSKNDVNHYFSTEEKLDKLLSDVRKVLDYLGGCALRTSFLGYGRRSILLDKWDKIKQEVNRK